MKNVKKIFRFSVFVFAVFLMFTAKNISGLNLPANEEDQMSVHFIDVGQGDSILIESDGHYMLVDAGDNSKETIVINYLKKQGVKKLDFIIGTHPHSDHIGGMDTVINSFPIGKVILPDVVHTTQTFEDVLDAIEDNNLKIKKAVIGDNYTIGSASFTIIAPNGTVYADLNDYSVGIKLENGSNTFLLAGDAETASEKEMMENGINLSANVLKLGHHGSSYSSLSSFLDIVNPDYAVISAGEGNQYGHPHQETLQKIFDRNIKLYRTDQQGAIIFISDGNTITTNVNAYKITERDLAARTVIPEVEPKTPE